MVFYRGGPHVVCPAQMKNLFNYLLGGLVRVVVGAALPASQPLVAEIMVSVPPQIECRSRDPEVSAGLVDVPDPLRVLNESFLSMNFSLTVGHSDPLGHLVP